jgi:hypothetical protein
MSESWWEYVQRVSAHASNKDVAAAAQMDPSAITRWKKGEKPRAESVVAFARGYRRPVLEALIAADYITQDDLEPKAVQIHDSVTELSDSDLLMEMQRRLANNDPRKIEPGSPNDVFPTFRDEGNRRSWGR